MKFQAHTRDEDGQVLLHVRMLDEENGLQQEVLGIVGVNLLYAAVLSASQAGAHGRISCWTT